MEIAVLDRTPYRMLGLGTYLLTLSQVLHLIIYSSQEYSVLSTMYDVLIEVTGRGIPKVDIIPRKLGKFRNRFPIIFPKF